MRRISEFPDEATAKSLLAYLEQNDIEGRVNEDQVSPDSNQTSGGSYTYSVWILDDFNMRKASELAKEFLSKPELKSTIKVSPAVTAASNETEKSKWSDFFRTRSPSHTSQRHEVRHESDEKSNNVTLFFLGICGIVFILFSEGNSDLKDQLRWLFIAEDGSGVFYGDSFRSLFPEVQKGQIWRLWTPVFLHFNWLHIIFNMMWLYQLGTLIETVAGRGKFLLLLAVIGLLSNVSQYVLTGPMFGGMSGVIYGLLAYVWGMQRWQAMSRYHLEPGIFGFMVVWLVLCLTGIFGPIANITHISGLGLGCLWAYLDSGRLRQQLRTKAFKK